MSFISPEIDSCLRNSIFNTDLGSALIGGSITALAVGGTIYWEAWKSRKSSEEEVQAVCGAIKTELEEILKQYNEVRLRVEVLEKNEPYGQNYRIDQDYFSVYHGNTSFIGKLPTSVRSDIVTAYTKMKSLVDTFCENNHILEGYEKFVLENTRVTLINSENESLRNHFQDVVSRYQESMVSMAQSLKQVNADAVAAADKAISSLNHYLNSKT